MNKTNDLVDFMKSLTLQISAEYNRIQKRSLEDPGTAGDQGEENWAKIFKEWLPSDYHIVTKGRLLNEKGVASPQVDVIILHPFYPKGLLDKKLYLTAGVAAAFECKNTLKAEHIKKTIKNSVEIRKIINHKEGNYKNELYSPVVYGLLAHSHSWKSKNSNTIDLIQKKIIEYDLKYVNHPIQMLDFLCISDLALWSSYKRPMTMIPNYPPKKGELGHKWIHVCQTGYGLTKEDILFEGKPLLKNFTPIGAFLYRLLKKISIYDSRLKDIANYFGNSGLTGFTRLLSRDWPKDIFTPEAIAKLDKISMDKNIKFFKMEE